MQECLVWQKGNFIDKKGFIFEEFVSSKGSQVLTDTKGIDSTQNTRTWTWTSNLCWPNKQTASCCDFWLCNFISLFWLQFPAFLWIMLLCWVCLIWYFNSTFRVCYKLLHNELMISDLTSYIDLQNTHWSISECK